MVHVSFSKSHFIPAISNWNRKQNATLDCKLMFSKYSSINVQTEIIFVGGGGGGGGGVSQIRHIQLSEDSIWLYNSIFNQSNSLLLIRQAKSEFFFCEN